MSDSKYWVLIGYLVAAPHMSVSMALGVAATSFVLAALAWWVSK